MEFGRLLFRSNLRFILPPAVVQWVQIARRFACSAEKFSLDNFDLIHPTEHVILLERQLVTSIEPARIRELQEKISKSKEFGSNRAGELAMKGQIGRASGGGSRPF